LCGTALLFLGTPPALSQGSLAPPGLVSPDVGSTTTREVPDTAITQRFFRIQATVP